MYGHGLMWHGVWCDVCVREPAEQPAVVSRVSCQDPRLRLWRGVNGADFTACRVLGGAQTTIHMQTHRLNSSLRP
eukprot:3743388-Prymnesium_polylepis.1